MGASMVTRLLAEASQNTDTLRRMEENMEIRTRSRLSCRSQRRGARSPSSVMPDWEPFHHSSGQWGGTPEPDSTRIAFSHLLGGRFSSLAARKHRRLLREPLSKSSPRFMEGRLRRIAEVARAQSGLEP